jgi:ABC-type polysaccharide transport system permease subunit
LTLLFCFPMPIVLALLLNEVRHRGLKRFLQSIAYLPHFLSTVPSLTTVNQPLRDMAGIATQMLLDLVRGVDLATTRIDLVNELVIRETTAPPARHG